MQDKDKIQTAERGGETYGAPRNGGYDDEIDLRDLALVLIRRKWLILAVVILGLGLASGYLALTPKTYTATRTLIFPADATTLKGLDLDADYYSAKVLEYSRSLDGVTVSASAPQGKSNRLVIEARGHDEQTLSEAFDNLPLFLTSLPEHLQGMEHTRQNVVLQMGADLFLLERYQNLLLDQKTGGGRNILLGFDVALAERDVQLSLTEKQDLLDNLEARHSIYYLQQDHAITSVRPNVQLVLALAAVASLMAGVFAAFFAEFVQGLRQRGGK
ncbi:Chain length determinant protein [Desulfonatronum thiosulfatophilum]|uniref:Chain length determinant protein n=1 Tax=Desulfonatronum thiosulfatophilum TaxID=617002 RepID=A0A1G6EBI4_9BACT|nr:Wzz/FepE/Etk N-terminal domain-containing protein [Desulfonatronum thiosulfatophilum]SDB54295.1 Chain length determinant protein [Desulfonatronum thiosulfatophilum]